MTGKRCSHVIITIDGPSGAGKSTVAQCLARLLGYWYVDSGAMYRAVGWLVRERALPLDDVSTIVACLERTPLALRCRDGVGEVWVDSQCVNSQLRGEAVAHAASAVATMPEVRQVITAKLRQLGCQADLVIEGRDIGTVVFPDADVKVYLDASPEERARRRAQDPAHAVSQKPRPMQTVVQALKERDHADRTRPVSPLVAADDAIYIDTTGMAVDEVVREVIKIVQDRIKELGIEN